ncbi:MAG: T9SS type A sorting domain-containing protein [Bacteroidia bacterium]|nr:T9SS type A sorting domain-containing protein [Bacteroidia bacterium]
MKRILLLFPLLAVTLLVLFINKKEAPEDYESWLMRQYQQIPAMDYAEAKALPKMDRPDLAAFQNYLMIVDPQEKRVPRERLKAAFLQSKALKSRVQDQGFEPVTWDIQPSIMGGRTRAILWDPNSTSGNKVWAGGVTGGLWFNNDITSPSSPWQSVDAFWANLAISCITFDPNHPEILYVGTGEVQTAIQTYRESSGVGFGIIKSSDGGITWDFLPSTQEWAYVTDLMVKNEGGTSILYAAVASGEYHGPQNSTPSDGLYRSEDNGETWEQVLPDIPGFTTPYTPADLVLTTNGRIIVGTMPNTDGQGGATLLLSDEGTSGTWTINESYKLLIEQGTGGYYLPGRIMLAAAPSDDNVVYAVVGGGYIDTYPYYHCRYVLRSDDKGETWNSLANPDAGQWASLAWHAFVVGVDPNDPENIFIGGLDQWKSINGGNYFFHVSDWSLMYYGGGDDYVHADQHVIAYKPGSSTEALFGSDGGIFYCNNANENNPVFQERNNNYNTLQFYSCAIRPLAGSPELIGGLQDNGSLWLDGTPVGINDMVQGGDGAFCFFDENESNIAYTSVYYNRYNVYVNGNQTNYLGEYTGTFVNAGDLDWKDNIMFNNAVTYSGQNSNKIQRYTNLPDIGNSSTFTVATGSTAYFSAISYSPHSEIGAPVIFAGTNAGKLFRVDDADEMMPQSTEITGTNFPEGSISSIAIAGSDDTLMVTFSNYGIPSVWQSFDGGATWADTESNLPDMPVRWALYHPQNSKQVMLATEIGIWTTFNAHDTEVAWYPDNMGMGNVRVDMLRIRTSDNTVVAATHGRGLHTAVWPLDVTVGLKETPETNFKLFPNPASGSFSVSTEKMYIDAVVEVRNLSGMLVVSSRMNNTTEKISIAHLSPGTYSVEIVENGRIQQKQKLIVAGGSNSPRR